MDSPLEVYPTPVRIQGEGNQALLCDGGKQGHISEEHVKWEILMGHFWKVQSYILCTNPLSNDVWNGEFS